jgi:hypothetical protein
MTEGGKKKESKGDLPRVKQRGSELGEERKRGRGTSVLCCGSDVVCYSCTPVCVNVLPCVNILLGLTTTSFC